MDYDDDAITLQITIGDRPGEAVMNQYAAIVLSGINDGLKPQEAVDFATMEWGQHPEWDWAVQREWADWGGRPHGLEDALLRLSDYVRQAGA